MKQLVRLLLLFSILLNSSLSAETLHNGVLNLSHPEYRGNPASVTGNALFYWKRYLTAAELDTAKPDAEIPLPGIWNDLTVRGEKISRFGYATIAFRITADSASRQNMAIVLPPIFSSYRLYIDSVQILQSGDPQKRAESTISSYRPYNTEFSFTGDTALVLFHIANFTNDKAGPWQTIYIGETSAVQRLIRSHENYDLFLLGGLAAFIAAYFMAFFMMRYDPSRMIYLWFALYTLTLFFRLCTTNTNTLYTMFPDLPDSIAKHIEYLATYLSALFYHSYVHLLFISVSSRKWMVSIRYIMLFLCGISLLTPLLIYSHTVAFFQIVILATLLYHVRLGIKLYKKEPAQSLILILSTIILVGTVIHDVLQVYGRGTALPLVPVSGVVVALIQSYFVARNSSRIHQERTLYAGQLDAVNTVLSRFVPKEFFTLLGSTYTSLTVGAQMRKKMSVAFCSIRNFEQLSSQLNSEKKFNLITLFLKEITPMFAKHGGFIDKYIGDSVMVIFPGRPEEAMKAALEVLEHFYSNSLSKECRGMQIGIGIHHGPMTLGVIGAEERMENTVIGDAVNTSSRMQSLSCRFGADLIVSSEVLCGGRFENETFHLRSLGTLAVKGKRERTTIQEVFFVREGELSGKLDSRNIFEQGVVFYEAGQHGPALQLFEQSLKLFPDDPAARAFSESCRTGSPLVLTAK